MRSSGITRPAVVTVRIGSTDVPDLSTSQEAGRTQRPASRRVNPDRTVHADFRSGSPLWQELVRYDRQGRWYFESIDPEQDEPISRERVKTVKDAAAIAVEIESEGGTIYLDRPGGNHFDYIVRCIKEKGARCR